MDGAPPTPPREPKRGLLVLTCMDARIDPLRSLGLDRGDAHVLRNAGAMVTEDVLRSARTSRDLMGTHTALVLGHSDCAGFDDVQAASEGARAAARALAAEGFDASAALYDVATDRVTPLD